MLPAHSYLHRVVAGYRLTDYVGAGGMGEVFKAWNLETGRQAAVKVLYRPEFAARFRNEASLQASISHLNIAALYDVTLIDDRPALVIEWIDGLSLDELIRRRERLSNEEASRIIRQIARAVAYLHQMGIIHRDLKPSNIRIRPDGQVKVLDFGIAKGRYTPQLTKVGHAVGTSEFMAPEQFRAQVEPKSDVWALGVLLYEMTTGHLPFDERNPLLLRHQIDHGHFTRPLLLNPTLSPELASVITQCLQTNPAKRPNAADIESILEKPVEQGFIAENLFSLPALPTLNWPVTIRYWLLAGAISIAGITFVNRTVTKPVKSEETVIQPPEQYEQIRVEVLNADYDLELVMPDGSVQSKEPFVVKRTPGQPLPITIRHLGAEQQFIIDPEVQDLYQCYFDR
ncbi:serine/threonine protein kinase [Spirosoma sp. KCTC 42546]|uniref:serine/threonine-protein kinase n=1 Tax=Spirosoma sp. KCTC 42546 TaxID=2520506 RepID=UPI00115A4568|nr:serine/threonine-protein kinase [Spirosoma sp. KCTC 42546]QDK79398.1 serine/threonine protein kinase [Spirosoma sp. KCTC 42546]